MRKSTNFNLNLVEGNDLVNPLVQDVPNYEAIDEQMYKNECNSIGVATELKSGTVHALTRTIPNASMFRFQATSNFTAGDTFTVDGIQVSALTPSGETLASGCYIIGSEVLCVLRETLLTVYVSGGAVTTAQDSEKLGGQLPEYYGTAENVTEALETAQSANRLTLTLQQAVANITNNLTLNYSNSSLSASTDINSFLQATLEKLFPKIMYIYNNGNVYSEITNGYHTSGSYEEFSTNKSGTLYLHCDYNSKPAYVQTTNKIDVSNYSKMHVIVTASALSASIRLYYSEESFNINNSTEQYVLQAPPSSTLTANNEEFVFDVSTMGSIFVGAYLSVGSSSGQFAWIKISEIWFE